MGDGGLKMVVSRYWGVFVEYRLYNLMRVNTSFSSCCGCLPAEVAVFPNFLVATCKSRSVLFVKVIDGSPTPRYA